MTTIGLSLVIYTGRRKVDSALKLKRLNQGVKLEVAEATITGANVSQLVAGFDLTVDAMDNLPARHILNKAALERNIPLFHGAVYGFEGRAMTTTPGQMVCLSACIGGYSSGEISGDWSYPSSYLVVSR